MKWSELKLTDSERRALSLYAIEDPDAVISLANGAPELAERLLSKGTIDRLRQAFPTVAEPPQVFELGARLDALQKPVQWPEDFEVQRSALLRRLDEATSPDARSLIESDLSKLYSNS